MKVKIFLSLFFKSLPGTFDVVPKNRPKCKVRMDGSTEIIFQIWSKNKILHGSIFFPHNFFSPKVFYANICLRRKFLRQLYLCKKILRPITILRQKIFTPNLCTPKFILRKITILCQNVSTPKNAFYTPK